METPGSTSDYSEGDARYEDVYGMRNPDERRSALMRRLYGTDDPEDPRVARDEVIRQMLHAKTLEEIERAEKRADEWLEEHPEDTVVIGRNAEPMANLKLILLPLKEQGIDPESLRTPKGRARKGKSGK